MKNSLTTKREWILFTITLMSTLLFFSCQQTKSYETDNQNSSTVQSQDASVSKEQKSLDSLNNLLDAALNELNTLSNNLAQQEDMKNYNWEGVYSATVNYVGYSLTISRDSPLRWAEFGFELEAAGIQTYYKIKGYAIRDNEGKLELHYMETVDGAFYQADQMDMNATMFKLEKSGSNFKTINGKWNVRDFVQIFKKE
jgi:hypothetical protein